MNFKKLLKRIVSVLAYGLLSTIVTFLIGLLLKHYFGFLVFNSMCLIGLIITCIGAMSSVEGNPAGVGIGSIGQLNSQYDTAFNIEVTKMEREATKYFESSVNHLKFYLSSRLNIMLNGAFVILSGILLYHFFKL